LEKLHNEELHNLYFSPVISRMIKSRRKSCRDCITKWGGEEYILVWNPEGKRPLGNQDVGGWVDDIKMDLR
jgi:hypothetical protein